MKGSGGTKTLPVVLGISARAATNFLDVFLEGVGLRWTMTMTFVAVAAMGIAGTVATYLHLPKHRH